MKRQHGDYRLIEECISVLRTAKMALEDLKDWDRQEEIRILVEKIIKIEEIERNLLSQTESPSVEDQFRHKKEPLVRRMIYELIRKFSSITGLEIQTYPTVELIVHGRTPSGKILAKKKIPTCYSNGHITINENHMAGKEVYAEEIGRIAPDEANAYLIGNRMCVIARDGRAPSPIIAGDYRNVGLKDDIYHVVPLKFFNVDVDRSQKYYKN